MSAFKEGDRNQGRNFMDGDLTNEKNSDIFSSELLNENDPLSQGEQNHIDDIVKIVMRKFNTSAKLQNTQSFFTQ